MTTAAPATSYQYDVERDDPTAPEQLGEGSSPLDAPKRRIGRTILRWVAIVLLVLVAIGVYVFAISPMGIGTSLVAFTSALVPVAIVVLGVWWLNRYTPLPGRVLRFAFGYGAAVSVLLSLVIGTVVELLLLKGGDAGANEFIGAVIQAPIVEESMKGLGLVILFLVARRSVTGPLDAVVCAALIAGGFAFTENILYFGRAFAQAQAAGETSAFWQTFVLRGLLSPFAHVAFTSMTGLGIGIAAQRRRFPLIIGLGLLGLSLAMALHALWNGATFFLDVDPKAPLASFLRYYLMVQVPIFVLIAAIMTWLRLREKRIVRRELAEYGRAGWFTPAEVDMLVSLRRRRRAEKWAKGHGALVAIEMRAFIRDAVELAMTRHAVEVSQETPRTRKTEAGLLRAVTAHRRRIGALSAPVVP